MVPHVVGEAVIHHRMIERLVERTFQSRHVHDAFLQDHKLQAPHHSRNRDITL